MSLPQSSSKMPFFKLKGTPTEIGFQHGSLLKERVRACFQFYTEKLIVNPQINLQEYGSRFLEAVRRHFPHYATEMEAIAEGAGMEPWQIGLLNARTEVFVKTMVPPFSECTLCFFRERGMLGENWDWMLECEDLIVLLEIERLDGHRILMVAEPGIIGKIGLNNAGLGLGLNILHGNQFEVGVPVHVLLRAALDSKSLSEVREIFDNTPFCAFSNVLIADEQGNYLDYELMGDTVSQINYGQANPIHTNHYLSISLDESANPMFEGSVERMERASSLDHDNPKDTLVKMKQILLDQVGNAAICSDFKDQFHFKVGTVSSLIMDLPRRKLWVTKGSPLRHDYDVYQLN